MIPFEGLLDMQADELSYLEGLEWGLFTANYNVVVATTLADVLASEASWTGYTRQTVSPWTIPSIVSGGAQTGTSALLTFTNSSGGAVTFFGWFAMNPASEKLVAALNIGTQTIPNGSPYSFAAALNDQNTGP